MPDQKGVPDSATITPSVTPSASPSGASPDRRPFYHPPDRTVKPKIGKNALGCILYVVFAIVALAALLMVAVSESGVVPVPFISQFYSPPAPTRVVQAGEEKPEQLLTSVQEAIKTMGPDESDTVHTLVYTEAELTAAVRGALADAGKRGDVDLSKTQVVIRPDAAQLTGRFRVKGVMVDAQLEVVPSVTNNILITTITKAKFGEIPIAPAIAKIAIDSLLNRDSSTWDVKIANHLIKDVQLQDGKLQLKLSQH